MLYIHLFGHLHLLSDSEPWELAVRPKTLSLWAYLLLHRAHPTPRASLAVLLWPDQTDSKARGDLRRHLHDLERALPPRPHEPGWLLRHGDTLQWNPQSSYWLDVAEFERLCDSPQHLAKAVTLYAGPLLPQVYEDWLAEERSRLDQLYLSGLRRLIAHSSAEGHVEQAAAYARQALNHDPLLEDVARELMRLLYESGKRTEALQAYQTFKLRLRDGLRVDPAQETRALFEVIMRAAPASGIRPPARSPESPQHNLPAPLTSFVGRDEEIAALHRMLVTVSSPIRLITLVGPPGTGKTRLALEAGRSLLERQASSFPDGMFFVDLSAITATDLVLSRIAATLGVKQSAERSVMEGLKEHLRRRYLLLILDNFEQVLEAGPAVGELLAAAPQLRVVVTSRAPLKLYGEHEFPVAPLALPERGQRPDLDALRGYGAVALFDARARQRQPAFVVNDDNATQVAEICLQLDGLPLAIELAASHIQTLSLAEMTRQMGDRLSLLASDLRDVSEKHKTLRAAIAWSYDLLDDHEQRLFRQLAVFAGGWSPEAARAVCGAFHDGQIEEGLARLAAKNLIEHVNLGEQARWQMLLTIREFGLDQLGETAEMWRVRQRHAQYFAGYVESLNKLSASSSDKSSLVQRLAPEDDNCQAALMWTLVEVPAAGHQETAGMMLLGAQLTVGLSGQYWFRQIRVVEALKWLGQANSYRQHLPLTVQTDLLANLGVFYRLCGDFAAAELRGREALSLARQLGNIPNLIPILQYLGLSLEYQGKSQEARQVFAEAVTYTRQHQGSLPPWFPPSRPLVNFALCLRNLGEYQEAHALLKEALDIAHARTDDEAIGDCLAELGGMFVAQQEYAQAEPYLREGLQLHHKVNKTLWVFYDLFALARTALANAEFERSARLVGFVEAKGAEFGVSLGLPRERHMQEILATFRDRLQPDVLESLLAEAAAMTLDQAVAFGLAE